MPVNSIVPLTVETGAGEAPRKELSGDAFLMLLVAQLRNQDPLQPTDPTEFITQLVQFNLLEQTIQIRQLVEKNSSGQTAAAAIAQS